MQKMFIHFFTISHGIMESRGKGGKSVGRPNINPWRGIKIDS